MIGHGHRLNQSAHLQRDAVGQVVDLVTGDDRVFGHAAIGHQAVKSDRGAEVVVAALARPAMPATVDRLDGDSVTLGDVGDTCADFGYHAGEFVADDEWHRLAGQRVWLIGWDEDRSVVVLVQVGAADAVATDPDLHLPLAGSGLENVFDLELVVSVVHSSAHDLPLRIYTIRTSFLLANSSRPKRPSSRPMPEFLTPPNGRSGALFTVVLRPTMPTSNRLATS